MLPTTVPAARIVSTCVDSMRRRFTPMGAGSVQFRGGSTLGPVLAENLHSYPRAEAADVYAELVAALKTCPTVQIAIGRKKVRGTLRLSGPATLPVTNESYGLSASPLGASTGVDIVVFSSGPIVGMLLYDTPSGGDPSALSDFAHRAVGKLESIG